MHVNPSDNPGDYHLAKLHALFSRDLNTPVSIPHTTTNASDLLLCSEALEELRRVSSLPYSACRSWLDTRTAVHIWPGSVSQEYIQLLYDKVPEALLVLGYYCVLLKQANYCWFFEGLGEALLGTIRSELGVEWEPWLKWAVDQPTSEVLLIETGGPFGEEMPDCCSCKG